MTDQLKTTGTLVESLGSALRRGDHALGTVPELLKRILREGVWREFVTQRGEHVEHQRFADFVVTPPLKGIGASIDLVRRVIADDKEALDLLDQALQNPQGGDHSKSDNIRLAQSSKQAGTSSDYALRKLRKDAPDLHAEVLEGNLSAHAAMVKAGFRPKTFTVRADNPESTAQSLRRHMEPEVLRTLARLLAEKD